MPVALFGLISCFALWDVFKFCSEKWGLDRYPVTRECVVRLSQCGEFYSYFVFKLNLVVSLAIPYPNSRKYFLCAFRAKGLTTS